MDQHPEIGICGTKVLPITKESKYKSWGNWLKTKPKVIDILLNVAFCHPTVMIRKSTILKNELYYKEDLKNTEDQELWFRAIKVTNFYNLKEKLFRYRINKTNTSLKTFSQGEDILKNLKIEFLQWLGVRTNNENINEKILSLYHFSKKI